MSDYDDGNFADFENELTQEDLEDWVDENFNDLIYAFKEAAEQETSAASRFSAMDGILKSMFAIASDAMQKDHLSGPMIADRYVTFCNLPISTYMVATGPEIIENCFSDAPKKLQNKIRNNMKTYAGHIGDMMKVSGCGNRKLIFH